MGYMARLDAIGLAAVVLACAACSTGSEQPVASSSSTTVSGRWFFDAAPQVPVNGHRATLFFEFVPDAGTPAATPRLIGPGDVTVSARCSTCNGSAITGTAN